MADSYLNVVGKLLKLVDNGDGTHSLSTVNNPLGPGSLYGSLDVTSEASEVKVGESPLEGRTGVLIANTGAMDVYVGFDDQVTTDTGIPVAGGEERGFLVNGVELYVVAVADTSVRVVEAK